MRTAITALLLLVSAVVTAVSITALPYYDDKTGRLMPLVGFTAALWLLFALAVFLLRRVRMKPAIALVIAGSVAIGGAALLGPPNTSTDSARYAWDGIVQNAGISPYQYVPADPALAELRPDWLFPAAEVDADGEERCTGARIMTVKDGDGILCTAINRAKVPTIYPPTSEIFFAGVRLLTGPEPQYAPMQVAGLLMSLTITGLLLTLLHRSGRDPRWAALWGWSPLAATEAVTNSHIDVLGGLLVLVATALVATGRRWSGGAALGAAIAVKLIPVIAAPALLRRQGWKVMVAAIVTFAVLYIPYIALTGFGVLGYLPGYLSEEGYSSGSRFIMLSLFAPGTRRHRDRRPAHRRDGSDRLAHDRPDRPVARPGGDDRGNPARGHPALPLVRPSARAGGGDDGPVGVARGAVRPHRAPAHPVGGACPRHRGSRDRPHRDDEPAPARARGAPPVERADAASVSAFAAQSRQRNRRSVERLLDSGYDSERSEGQRSRFDHGRER